MSSLGELLPNPSSARGKITVPTMQSGGMTEGMHYYIEGVVERLGAHRKHQQTSPPWNPLLGNHPQTPSASPVDHSFSLKVGNCYVDPSRTSEVY